MNDEGNRPSRPSPDSLPEIWADLTGRLARERGGRARLRSLSTPVRSAVAGGVFLAVALLVGLALRRTDFPVYPVLRFALLAAGLVAAAALATASFLRPLHRRRPAPRARRAVLVLVLAFPFAMAALPAAHAQFHAHPESAGDPARFLPAAAHCLMMGSLFALPLLAALLGLDRRDRLEARRALLLAGAAAVLGNLGLLLYCPIVSSAHRLAGHAAVVVVLAGISALRCNRSLSAP